MLEDGDVILTQTNNGSAGYIYFGQTLYKHDGSTQEITDQDLDKFLRNLIGRNYIILRPYTN